MKTIIVKEVELFKNLSQLELDDLYYDFHNDFNCIKVFFESSILVFLFKNIITRHVVSFKFDKTILEKFEFFNFEELNNLTIDNLYRGRFQKGRELMEFNIDGKSYFYVEFYEGPKIELWCENIIIEEAEM